MTEQTPRAKALVLAALDIERAQLCRLLDEGGVEAIAAGDGEQALQACREHRFALVLLDLEADGFAVASQLAEMPLQREVPIIFLAETGDIDSLKAHSAGAADYIIKPVNSEVLLLKARVMVEYCKSRQQVHELQHTVDQSERRLAAEIAERHRVETLVRHQAHHDVLTSLPNRILFLDRFDTALERAARHHKNFALLYIDIDGFKPVNDTHGHLVGDELLRHIGQRLSRGVRKTDTVSRIGGDEFAVILEEVVSDQAAVQVGTKLCELLAAPYLLKMPNDVVRVQIGASIGISIFPEHGRQQNELISAADAAMYRAKREGKNRTVLAEAEVSEALVASL